MPIIKFSKEEKEQMILLTQEYLKEELDCEARSFYAQEIGGWNQC